MDFASLKGKILSERKIVARLTSKFLSHSGDRLRVEFFVSPILLRMSCARGTHGVIYVRPRLEQHSLKTTHKYFVCLSWAGIFERA